MIQMLIGFVIGVVVGWNWAQPGWAKGIQTRFVKLIRIPSDKTDQN